MTQNAVTNPATAHAVPLVAAVIAAVSFAVWGVDRGVAAAASGSVAALNWYALRWIVQRITAGEMTQRLGVTFLLVAKMGLLMAAVFVLVRRLELDPLGVLLGLSTLFIAPVASGLFHGSSAATAAREER